MPYLHCNSCHHEWEGRLHSICDWCGAGSFVLEAETPLEWALSHGSFYRVVKEMVKEVMPVPECTCGKITGPCPVHNNMSV